ncbi:unnamed protein product [Cylicostephanus goldi]|uniref:Uncharacterized protein n=1 Tax=Cylicostephanus goldi TaxID=71465 RepID=A0A3P6SSY3_CYLGO|nr:unnamed protein product [Cylicostephanus goldi]
MRKRKVENPDVVTARTSGVTSKSQKELEQVMETERNFKQLIQDLADRKVCPPRRFTHGFIPRQRRRVSSAKGEEYPMCVL